MAPQPPFIEHDDEDEPVALVPAQRTREQVLIEYRETNRRRLHIRGEWDQCLRDIDSYRLQHRLAVEAIEILTAELSRMDVG